MNGLSYMRAPRQTGDMIANLSTVSNGCFEHRGQRLSRWCGAHFLKFGMSGMPAGAVRT